MFHDRNRKAGDWAIPQQSKLRYTQIFNQHDRNRTGFLTGLQCRNILLQTGLPQNVLAQIWDLSDIDSDGQLTREEFLLAMHLTDFVKSGNNLPAELPPDLVPPSYRRTRSISVASVVSSGSVSSSAAVDDVGLDGTESGGSASSAKNIVGPNTFEDKRRENFEKGQAELERRRLQLLEQQRHEQEARQRKDREEAEKREKFRLEAERKRQEELERLQEKNRQIEAEKGEQKRQQLEKRELARRELERQRMAELESLRQQELLVQSQTAQEAMVHLKTQKQNLSSDVEKLDEQYDIMKESLNSARMLVSNAKSKIDNLRTDRDTKMGLITSLRAQIQALVDKRAFLEKEESNLIAIARDLNLMANTAQVELDLQAIQAKQISIGQMKDEIGELIKEKETKSEELDSSKVILKECLAKLQLQTDAANEAYRLYQDTLEKAKILREEYVKQSKMHAQNLDALWDSKSGDDSWMASDQGVKDDQSPRRPDSKVGIKYKALYAFEARNTDELTINPGDIIAAVDTLTEPGWLSGALNGKTGWFPEAYVEKLNDGAITTQYSLGQSENLKESQQSNTDAFGLDSFGRIGDNVSFASNQRNKGSIATVPSISDPNKRQDSNATSNSDPSPSSAATTVVEAGFASDSKQSNPQSSMEEAEEVFDKLNINDEYCLTLYPFESTESGDLAFTSDEYIKIQKKEGDWWTGEVVGNPSRSGMFPSNYVKPIERSSTISPSQNTSKVTPVKSATPTQATNTGESGGPLQRMSSVGSLRSKKSRNKKPEVATVVANYRALGQEQLSLEKGQLVLIRRKMDSGWWEGEIQIKGKKKQFGWFPASYVKPLSSATQSDQVTSAKCSTGATNIENQDLEKVVALYKFSAQHDDELSFEPGEIILILSKNEDPTWWKGKSLSTGAVGLFPSNHTEAYVEQKIDQTSWTSFDIGNDSTSLTGNTLKPTVSNVDSIIPLQSAVDECTTNEKLGSSDAKRNQFIIKELIETEKDYVADLDYVIDTYINPLSKLLSVREQEVIFINWQQLSKMHHSLLNNLERVTSKYIEGETRVLNVSIKCMIDFLKQALEPYIIFCCNQLEACRILRVKLDSDVRFRQLMRDCDRHNNSKRLPFTSYLLKPMQRITRYSLLLEKIMVSNCNHNNDDDDHLLIQAYDLAQKLCHQVNEACKSQQDNEDNSRKLQWSQVHIKLTSSNNSTSLITGSSSSSSLSSSTAFNCSNDRYLDQAITFDSLTNCLGRRKLIKAGTLIKSRSAKELMAFLYNDFLLLTLPTIFLPKVVNLFDSKRALQAYYKIYRRPLLLDRIAIISDIYEENSLQSTNNENLLNHDAIDIDQVNEDNQKSTRTQILTNTSFRLDYGVDGKMYTLRAINLDEKKSWLKELKIASERMIESKLRLRSVEPIIRKPDPSHCSGRLFVTLVEAKYLKHSKSCVNLYAVISLICCYDKKSSIRCNQTKKDEILDRVFNSRKSSLDDNCSTSNITINDDSSSCGVSVQNSGTNRCNLITSVINKVSTNQSVKYDSTKTMPLNEAHSNRIFHSGEISNKREHLRQISDRFRSRTAKAIADPMVPITSCEQIIISTTSNNNHPICFQPAWHPSSTSPVIKYTRNDLCNSFNVVWNDSTQFLLGDIFTDNKDYLLITINEDDPFSPMMQLAKCILPISDILSSINSSAGPIERTFPLDNEILLYQNDPTITNESEPLISLDKCHNSQMSKSLTSFSRAEQTGEKISDNRYSCSDLHMNNSMIRLRFDVQLFS